MKRIALLLAVLALAGCEGSVAVAHRPAEAEPRPPQLPSGVKRVKIGACWYVIMRGSGMFNGSGNSGVAIVHAADCPNHDWSFGGGGGPRVTAADSN